MRKVFINSNTLAIIIAKEQNFNEYENDNYFLLCEGNNKFCLQKIEEYWEENNILEEQQIILND